jgi:tetratricopeptide (TPR) repeat protein
MNPLRLVSGFGVAVLVAAAVAIPSTAQEEREEFTNLQVLPKDIAPEDLRKLMGTFTRALGVRCIHCHVGEEGKPFEKGAFAKDDKPTKLKAREMMRMTNDLNEKYLAKLAVRADPPIRVQCITCHHGITQPRQIQDLLTAAYDKGGMDSTLTTYHALRDRYYGSFAYDFGEVPLVDVASTVRAAGHFADAESLLALDVALNPKSAFAKRRHANLAITQAFLKDTETGAAAYRNYKEKYSAEMISETFLNNIGYELLAAEQKDAALRTFEFIVAENPASANAYDSLGEAYMTSGDPKKATAAYKKSLELDPKNDNAKQKLEELKKKPKNKAKGVAPQ